MSTPSDPQTCSQVTKGEEIKTFLIITFILFPMLAIGVVGTFGFVVWISQILLGPPSA